MRNQTTHQPTVSTDADPNSEAQTSLILSDPTAEEDRVLDMNDLLKRLPFSRKIVLRMIHQRRIPALLLNGKWVISRKQFVKAMNAGFPVPKGKVRNVR